ncbi:hypothetical protein BaRGS_00018797 [Batillaria attramentaria]|uniref:STAS domain-containing protein n=1 Tax=Batillaria attramentaria TaxID=370345 RepID=A0ABD0KRM2_9CAEN
MTSREGVRTALVDLSGTLHIDDMEVPGSVEALKRLRKSGMNIKFVTNTTKESKRVLHDHLLSLGFDIKRDEIFTSLTAARHLLEQRNLQPLVLDGAPLIAIHKARYYKRKDGMALGPGPFVAALEFSTDKMAEVVGKPESRFFLSAVEEFGCHPSQCVMIGDDARDDIGGAQNSGMKGILVKTGKYRGGDEKKIDPPPQHVADDFSAAVDFILSFLL